MTKPLFALAEQRRGGDIVASLTNFTTTAVHGTYGAYGWLNGSRINKRTHDALMVAGYVSGWGTPTITQGGLNGGAVAASAGTHNGLDVADVQSRGRSKEAILRFVEVAMDCGAIGFIRGETFDNISDGMVEHIHFVMVGARYAHPEARAQIYNMRYGYAYGGAGLAGLPNARWWGPARKPLVEWSDSKLNPKNGWLPA